MTLLISIFAAVTATVVWYKQAPADIYKTSLLVWLFWGSSIMWLVDAVFEYIELGAKYFTPEPRDMLNDAFLGLSAVALALVIWVIYLLFKDPKGVIKAALTRKKER